MANIETTSLMRRLHQILQKQRQLKYQMYFQLITKTKTSLKIKLKCWENEIRKTNTLFEIFIFCPTLISRENCRLFLGEKLVKMLEFCQNWIFGQKFDFSNSVNDHLTRWYILSTHASVGCSISQVGIGLMSNVAKASQRPWPFHFANSQWSNGRSRGFGTSHDSLGGSFDRSRF